MQEMISELRKILGESVRRNKANGLLFSGGLDSAIIACLDPEVKAITINFCSYGEDINYAESLAKTLKIEHHRKSVSPEEAIEAVPEVIKILKTFDPAIPNDIVAYIGLKKARKLGLNKVATGDGSDELFAGYGFMRDLEDLEGYIRKLSGSLAFSSNELAGFFGIAIKQPYLDDEIIDFSLGLGREHKIKSRGNSVHGKWILRKAFEGRLPDEFVWQDKRPLEYG